MSTSGKHKYTYNHKKNLGNIQFKRNDNFFAYLGSNQTFSYSVVQYMLILYVYSLKGFLFFAICTDLHNDSCQLT